MNKRVFIILSIFLLFLPIFLLSNSYVTVTAKKGNGILDLLAKYSLNRSKENIEAFKTINAKKINKNDELILNEQYILPIQIVKFNGKSIRSSLKITDYELAKSIENYNLKVESSKIKLNSYKNKYELWVPVDLLKIANYFKSQNLTFKAKEEENNSNKKDKEVDNPTECGYLTSNKNYKIKNKKLKNHVFYLISGHGGPDPGAICMFGDNNELHEHEYAYDVTIRLAKKLLESSAKVYMIVQDSTDGIRDVQILKNGGNERLINGDTISSVQVTRLKQRTDLVNSFALKNKNKKQILLELHVDSRITDQRIDIFFYYRNGDKSSENLSQKIFETINRKYSQSQPGRGYKGNVSARDLFTLRNTTIPATYIELGNIQNQADQVRLLEPNNRQAMANWIFEGIVSYVKQ